MKRKKPARVVRAAANKCRPHHPVKPARPRAFTRSAVDVHTEDEPDPVPDVADFFDQRIFDNNE